MATEGEASSNYAYNMIKTLQDNHSKTVLVIDGKAVTGWELHQRICVAIHQLRASGIVPGDRLLITMAISIDFYALAIATFVIGGCLVILDPSMGLERANHCIANARPAAWILPSGSWYKYLKYLLPALRLISIQLEINNLATTLSNDDGGEMKLPDGMRLVEAEDCVPVEHALVTFTTGSTGFPKLMLRKHGFVQNQSRSISMMYERKVENEIVIKERDCVICTNIPLFGLHYIRAGTTVLLFPNIAKCNPSKMIKTMKTYNCTVFGGSPAFVHKMARYAVKHNITLPIKLALMGGAPVFRAMFRTIVSIVPDKKAIVVYGSTEAEPVSLIFAEEKLKLEAEKPDGLCVGRPVYDDSAIVTKILNNPPNEPVEMSSLELPRGQIGEILVSGWHVNTHQVDPKRLVTDVHGKVWLRIEDAGYMDDEGRLWLVGRVKWRVERGGKTFWSTVVEQKVLDRCSILTFAAYLPHKEEAWLFLEAPRGLPASEESALKQFLLHEGIPVDHLEVKPHIPKDRRHLSKPNTAVLFAPSFINRYSKLLLYLLRSNPLLLLLMITLQILLLSVVLALT